MVDPAKPADGLLVQCEAPVFVPTLLVRDINENKIRAFTAYERCAARVRCLIWWIATANHETPPADCRSDTPPVTH